MSKDNDTEERILRAAEQEFMNKGFAGARTTSIAEAAGVTHAMFHYYFRTKEKLFERIAAEKTGMIKEILSVSIAESGLSLEGLVKSLISRHLDFLAENPDLPRFFINELYYNPDRAEAYTEKLKTMAPELISALSQKIDNAVAEGKCRPVNPTMLFLDILSLNIFPFLINPLAKIVFSKEMINEADFLRERKEENFRTIMGKLRP